MPTEKTCPTCGKPLTDNALMGLCPECLLQAGFGTMDTRGDAAEKSMSFVPPTPEELAHYFPELEIIKLLGRGGMGAVYKARQKRLERLVALKILPPNVGQDPSFADRFEREAKALAQLHHPNIVTLYDSGQVDGLFYFFMEFVDGVNLRQLLDTGHVSPKEALAIVPQICDALQFAHDRRIIHRDIKPENILLNKEGRVKIADFGVAKIVAHELPDKTTGDVVAPELGQTEAGKVIGTPQYMAPEQLSNPLDVDNRADIYALGVVFYQMLTGELPAGKFGPPSSKVQIDVRLDDIVLRALQKQPELRYQQASALKTQVETIAATQSKHVQLDSKQGPSGEVHKPWLYQYRWILILTALILIPIMYVLVRDAAWIKNGFLAFVTPLDGAYKPSQDPSWILYLKKDGTAYYYSANSVYSTTYKVTGQDVTFTFPDGITDVLRREGDTLVGNENNKILGDETMQYRWESQIPPHNGLLSSVMKKAAQSANTNNAVSAPTATATAHAGDISVYITSLGSVGTIPERGIAKNGFPPTPITFSIPEQDVQEVVGKFNAKQLVSIEAYGRDMKTRIGEGSLVGVDNQIDESTGTLKCKGAIAASPGTILFPNMSLNIRMLMETKHDVTLLPAKAIQYGDQGAFVYFIMPDNTVTIRQVTIGTIEGEMAEIKEGLSPGGTVVLDVPTGLREGSKILVQGEKPAPRQTDATTTPSLPASVNATTVSATKDLVGVGRLYHALVYHQTSSTPPKLSPDTYQFIADIPNNTFPINGGTVSLPAGATWPTNPVTVVNPVNLVGAHYLYVQGFDSKAALWSNFPDGNYVYNIQPRHSGDQTSSYSVQVPFTGSVDFPPIAPVVTNETWKSGALVLQPTSAIINFTNYPGAALTWEIVAPGMSAGGGGNSLGSLNLTGMLGYGKTYQAQLRFINHDSSKTVSNPNEPKDYNYETMMATIVEFTITTPESGKDAESTQGSPAAGASSPESIIQTIANNFLSSQGSRAAGPLRPVSITKAYYEAKDGAGAKDVTGIISKMLKNNRLDVTVGTDVFGGDPAWLHVKQLRVDYTIDGKKYEETADEGTTLSIPDQTLAPTADTQVTSAGRSQDDKKTGDKKYEGLFALPPVGSLGPRGRAMEIHATFSRQLEPGVAAVHYFDQYRGVDAGISFGDEIAIYGLPSSFGEWRGNVYPAGYMTFGKDRLFVYATTKEQAIALLESENEKDRKFAP